LVSSPEECIGVALREAENQLRLIIEFEESFEKRSRDHVRQFFADELEKIIQSMTSQAEAIQLSGGSAWVSMRRGAGDVYSVEAIRYSFRSQANQHVTLANMRAQGQVMIPFETFEDIASAMNASVLSGELNGNLRLGVKRLLYDRAYAVTAHYVENAQAEFTKISSQQYGSSSRPSSGIWTLRRGESRIVHRRAP
jgi:hypothetical protein